MGETVGQLTGLLTSEEDSRVVLLALVLFLICTIVIVALIAVLFKMVRNIKEASREEFGKDTEFESMRKQVNETKEDIQEITQLIVRLTETVNASNTHTQKDLESIRKSLAINSGGCELGKALDKEIKTIKSEVLRELRNDIALLMESDKESIKSYIIKEYQYWMRQGKIDIYSWASIQERYAKYTKEKGNTFVSGMVEELRRLPKICVAQNVQSDEMIRDRNENRIGKHPSPNALDALNAMIEKSSEESDEHETSKSDDESSTN